LFDLEKVQSRGLVENLLHFAFSAHDEPMLHVVLVEPEIPQNTGNIARLCVASGARLHLVGPLGFSINGKEARRAGMDYWHRLDLVAWNSWDEFLSANGGSRLWLLSSKVERPYWDTQVQDGDMIVFGRESKGLPASLLAAHPESCLTIPMSEGTRSINLATSVGIVLYEGIRQLRVAGEINLAGGSKG
jgi:tRNA (cytidine/uridine-2'-O-)-methyltransferase